MDFTTYLQSVGGWLMTTGVQIAIILILMVVALKGSGILSARLFSMFTKEPLDIELQKRADTLGSVVRYTLNIIILVVASMMVLGELGVEIAPVLAAAGVVGLAVGFGAQKLVEDVISGFFILLEDQIRVGDVVQLGDKGGLVERVTLRMVILRDLAGNVHYVRNGQIGIVTNMTKEYSRYVFDIGVAYREDTDEVVEIIKKVDEDLRGDPDFKADILEPMEILGVDQFADSAVVIKTRTKTLPIKQWNVAREFNRRLKKAFDEKGIEIPFPHTTLYMGEAKDGSSPALNVNMLSQGKR